MHTIIRTFFIAILSIAFAATSYGQDENSTVKNVVQQIAAHNCYESSHIGVVGAKSKQYTRFEQLVSIASEPELTELATLDTNAVVRLYALQALHYKRITVAKDLQKRFAEDQTKVRTHSGCIGNTLSVQSLAAGILKQRIPRQ